MGILVSLYKGRTRLFHWNPRWPFQAEFRQFLAKVYEYLPENEKEIYKILRCPRRGDKK